MAQHERSRYELGMAVRRDVLGHSHVDRAESNKTDFDADFQAYITENAWGSVWSRDGLTRRERSLVTIALLAAMGQDDELAMHIRATRNTGTSEEDVREVLMHLAIYAGIPAANTAIRVAKHTYTDMKRGSDDGQED